MLTDPLSVCVAGVHIHEDALEQRAPRPVQRLAPAQVQKRVLPALVFHVQRS